MEVAFESKLDVLQHFEEQLVFGGKGGKKEVQARLSEETPLRKEKESFRPPHLGTFCPIVRACLLLIPESESLPGTPLRSLCRGSPNNTFEGPILHPVLGLPGCLCLRKNKSLFVIRQHSRVSDQRQRGFLDKHLC